MAATVLSLRFRTKRRSPIPNSSFLHRFSFSSSSSTPSDSSTNAEDHNTPSSPPHNVAPPPGDNSSQQQQQPFEGVTKAAAIFFSISKPFTGAYSEQTCQLPTKEVDPNNRSDSRVVLGGTDKQLPVTILREKKGNESAAGMEFGKNNSYDELGQKLRPEGEKGGMVFKLRKIRGPKKGEWYSNVEMDEKETIPGLDFEKLRLSLQGLKMPSEEKTKKQSNSLDEVGDKAMPSLVPRNGKGGT